MTNVEAAKVLAGIVFPIGLMMIVFIGGDLFTGDNMMFMEAMNKCFTYYRKIKFIRVLRTENI